MMSITLPLVNLSTADFNSLIREPYKKLYDGMTLTNATQFNSNPLSKAALSKFLYKYFTVDRVYDRKTLLSNSVHTFLIYSNIAKKMYLSFIKEQRRVIGSCTLNTNSKDVVIARMKMSKMIVSNEDNQMILVCVNGLKANENIINQKSRRKIIAVVNLLEITNWSNMETQDNVATVSFSNVNTFDSENACHYSFPFVLNSYRDLQKFTLEFIDVEDNLINFSGDNKTFPLVLLKVDILTKTRKRRFNQQ